MDTGKQPRITSYLVFRHGDEPEQVVLWDTVEITVGRHDSQDIVVPDSEVSREHAVFRHKGDRFTIEDRGTGLGTLVNGEPVRLHELQPDDIIAIGMLKLKFGQTTKSIKPGGNIRFASQLKGFGVPDAPDGAGGRTMMAFNAEDSLLSSSAPTLIKEIPRARAVSADGILEEVETPDILGSEDFDLGAPEIRDLDEDLAQDLDSCLGPVSPEVSTAETSVRLVLEVAGPAEQVEALLTAIRDKRIEVPPITLCVRDPRQR